MNVRAIAYANTTCAQHVGYAGKGGPSRAPKPLQHAFATSPPSTTIHQCTSGCSTCNRAARASHAVCRRLEAGPVPECSAARPPPSPPHTHTYTNSPKSTVESFPLAALPHPLCTPAHAHAPLMVAQTAVRPPCIHAPLPPGANINLPTSICNIDPSWPKRWHRSPSPSAQACRPLFALPFFLLLLR